MLTRYYKYPLAAHILTAILTLLTACSAGESAASSEEIMAEAPKLEVAQSKSVSPEPARLPTINGTATSNANQTLPVRYIALSQQISLRIPGPSLQSAWETLQQQALQMNGEIVNAALDSSHTDAPSASLSVRIPPENLNAYLALLKKSGTITSQHIGSEDKTREVIDIDARMKNLAEARDQLRLMLAERKGKLSEILEVQKALTETQSELDSLTGQRKALEALTSRVSLNIQLNSAVSLSNNDDWTAWDAILSDWQSIGYGVTAIALTLVGMLPLLIPAGIIVWLIWRRITRTRRKRITPAGSQQENQE